jgi:hypothetical protein
MTEREAVAFVDQTTSLLCWPTLIAFRLIEECTKECMCRGPKWIRHGDTTPSEPVLKIL